MASLDPYFAIFCVLAAIAILYPLGAFLRGTPCQVDGDHGLRSDLPAEGDEVVSVDLMKIESVSVGLGLYLCGSLQRASLVHRKKPVFPTVFSGEIAAGPAHQPWTYGFKISNDIGSHPMEIVLGHHRDRSEDNLRFLSESKPEAPLLVCR